MDRKIFTTERIDLEAHHSIPQPVAVSHRFPPRRIKKPTATSKEQNEQRGNPRSRSRTADSIQSLACKHGEPHSTKPPRNEPGTESNAGIRVAACSRAEPSKQYNHHHIHYRNRRKLFSTRNKIYSPEWKTVRGRRKQVFRCVEEREAEDATRLKKRTK